jgi:AbrB family looped-hinge helix DNA binding protein
MATVLKISPQGQIRIPKKLMESLDLQKGDYVEMELEKNEIVLKPRKLIDPNQGWYWTKEWQKEEAEVNRQVEKGELSPKFRTAEEGLEWLKK